MTVVERSVGPWSEVVRCWQRLLRALTLRQVEAVVAAADARGMVPRLQKEVWSLLAMPAAIPIPSWSPNEFSRLSGLLMSEQRIKNWYSLNTGRSYHGCNKRGALKQHEKTEPQSDRKQDVTRNITRVTYILSQHKSVLLSRSTLPLSRPSDECLATLHLNRPQLSPVSRCGPESFSKITS